MKTWIHFISMITLGLLLQVSAYAANPNTLDAAQTSSIKSYLIEFENDITTKTLDYWTLKAMLKRITSIKSKVQGDLKVVKKDLEHIDKLISNIPVTAPSVKTNPNYKFLTDEKSNKEALLADYSLIVYKADQLIEHVSDLLSTARSGSSMFTYEKPQWRNLTHADFENYTFDKHGLYEKSGLIDFQNIAFLALTCTAFFVGVVLAYGFYLFRVRVRIKERLPLSVLSYYFPLLLGFLAVYLVFTVFYSEHLDKPLSFIFTEYLLMYLVIMTIISIYIFWATNQSILTPQWGTILERRLKILASIAFSWVIIQSIVQTQNIPAPLYSAIASAYWTLILSMFVWSLAAAFHLSFVKQNLSKGFMRLGYLAITVLWVGVVYATWDGYIKFAYYLIPNLVMSTLLLFIACRMIYSMRKYNKMLYDTKSMFSRKIHAWLGLPIKRRIPEFFLIRTLLTVSVAGYTILALMWIWEVPDYYAYAFLHLMRDQHIIMGLPVTFVKILRGIMLFCLIMAFGRALAVKISKSPMWVEEKYARVTVMTVVQYCVFVIALCVALIEAGVNLSGFALVAGALSVGIGFGLQKIASDLVSGLILLVNRPVKPGDHVVIDKTEGFVKKIRLLSTHIKTYSKSNVIIPNSNLINKSLTNYSYHTKLSHITCKFVLSNVEDLDKAEKALMDVAIQQPGVVTKGRNKPMVSTTLESGEITINLSCHIRDANKIYSTTSKINEAVLRQFKELGIALK